MSQQQEYEGYRQERPSYEERPQYGEYRPYDQVTPPFQTSSYSPSPGKISDGPRQKDVTVFRFVLGIVSLGVLIPLTAISLTTAGLPGLLLIGVVVVAINVSFALGSRRF